MRMSFSVLVFLGVAACAAQPPRTHASRPRDPQPAVHRILPGPPAAYAPGSLCLLSTPRCRELWTQPPRLCLTGTERCPVEGRIVPLAALEPR